MSRVTLVQGRARFDWLAKSSGQIVSSTTITSSLGKELNISVWRESLLVNADIERMPLDPSSWVWSFALTIREIVEDVRRELGGRLTVLHNSGALNYL